MHAAWNLLARHRRSEAQFIWQMLFVTAAVGLLPGIVSELYVRSMNSRAWLCVVGSGICCGVYFFGLVRAYGSSDFTVVYPVARSLPVLLVAVGDLLRGRPISPAGWIGMSLVVAGCVLIPHTSFRELRLTRYWDKSLLWMLLAAVGTVGFTLLDKVASETVRQGPGTAGRYGCFFFLFTFLVFAALIRAFRTTTRNPAPTARALVAAATVLNFLGYWLVLWAYQLSESAGYIIAFRQMSVVIGVIAAFLIYKERGVAVRLIGILVISAGLVLISLCGGE